MIDIQLIKIGDAHWVSPRMDGHELERRGPFSTMDEAEAMAARIGTLCRALFHSGVIVMPAAPRRRRA